MDRGMMVLGTRLLYLLESDCARKPWGRWKGVRVLIAYPIWWFRFHHHPARRKQ